MYPIQVMVVNPSPLGQSADMCGMLTGLRISVTVRHHGVSDVTEIHPIDDDAFQPPVLPHTLGPHQFWAHVPDLQTDRNIGRAAGRNRGWSDQSRNPDHDSYPTFSAA
jgi:hypothetical protein